MSLFDQYAAELDRRQRAAMQQQLGCYHTTSTLGLGIAGYRPQEERTEEPNKLLLLIEEDL